MSNQVDFAFQSDVTNLGSLTHMLTGRVLKALSDGKVDIYAVGAAFWLGGKVPIRSSLAETVHSHVSQRRGYQSVLSKALSIGWGHSTPVVEMTRTRAGTNALLLVGALGTGATAFQAAQCLSELMSACGIGLSKLPSVDVLKDMVTYLTPFVHDLGFSKVLQHITDVSERALRADIVSQSMGAQPRRPQDEQADRQALWELKNLGSASALASAIKQLLYTSQHGQEDYMILEMRGSWLPAFASHLLGMSVELRCNGKLVWACGGDKGSIIFQLGKHPMDNFSIKPSHKPHILIASPGIPEDDSVLSIDYSIEDVVEALLTKEPLIDSDLSISIHAAIRRMAEGLSPGLVIKSRKHRHKPFRTTGEFDKTKGLEEVLRVLRIKSAEQQSTEIFPRQIRQIGDAWSSFSASSSSSPSVSLSPLLPQSSSFAPLSLGSLPLRSLVNLPPDDIVQMGPSSHGLTYMARDQVLKLAGLCEKHRSDVDLVADTMIDTLDLQDQEVSCVCQHVGTIIHNLSVIALALAHCKFDPSELRVQEDFIIRGFSKEYFWCESLLPPVMTGTPDYKPGLQEDIFKNLLHFLAQVFCVDYSNEWRTNTSVKKGRGQSPSHLLGLSGRMYTIHYSCITENDCYDTFGRTLQIRTGRASVAGCFRNTIEEKSLLDWDDYINTSRELTNPTLLAGGSLLRPHYRPPKTEISMEVALHETTIELKLQVANEKSPARRWAFTECMTALLSGLVVPSCEHQHDSAYELVRDEEVALEGFNIARLREPVLNQVLVLALQGNKLEQLVICGILMQKAEEERSTSGRPRPGHQHWKQGLLQMSSCLKCCIRLAQRVEDYLPWVIIGG